MRAGDVARPGSDPPGDLAKGGSRTYVVRIRRLCAACGAVAAAIGGVYLVAWLLGVAARWSATGVITMKTNMALSLLLAGVALVLIERDNPSSAHRIAASAMGVLVLLVGVLTLSEHVLGWDLGIDQLLASEAPGAVATLSPNRVGIPGSACLTLLGGGLLSAGWRRSFAAHLGLTSCIVVVVPAIGFLYGLNPFYAAPATAIAWPTVVALFSAGLALMLSPREGSPFAVIWRDDAGGELVRRLIVPSIVIVLFLGYLRVQGERAGLYAGPTGTGLYTVALILVLSALLWMTARQLSAYAIQRRHAVDELAAEKERLAVTLGSIGDAVIATDSSGRVTLLNAVAEVLTGWKFEEAVGRPLHEIFRIVNEETGQQVESPVDRVLREGAVVGLANHTALIARSGTARPIADSGAPIRERDGEILGVVLVFRDQTKERQVAEELHSAHKRAEWLASFPARNPVPIAEVDAGGHVRYANEAAERSLPGIRSTGMQHPWLTGWSEVVREFREQGARSQQRTVVVGESSYQQMMYYVPETECIRIYSMDVTQRVAAEAALRDSESRFRALADSMPQLAWTARADGFIDWYNRRWYEYTGTTPEQMEGWGWKRVHDPNALPDVLRRWTESIATGSPFEMEFPLRGADGAFRRFLTRVVPLKDEHGNVLQWFGTNTDVTALVEAEQKVRDASRRKDEFLGMLSHELRNPLAPIRNSVHVLERTKPDSEQARRAQAVVKRQVEHLTRIVDDLLDVSRIERGKFELQRSRFGLRELASQVVDDLREITIERGIELRTEFPETELWMDADRTRIAQVLGNLLHNAVKFANRGDEVTLSIAGDQPDAEIVVRDTGIGIQPALLDHVFEPFVQGNRSLARTEGGLGLGLAIVKAIAQLHGGSVRVESAGAGHGSTFVVRLPRAVAPSEAREAEVGANGARRARKVLVVDDNRDAAESLADIVTMLGHEAEVVYDGLAAVEKVRADSFDTVLCDIGLPGMTGYEVATALRASHGRRLRLLAVSGYARPEDVQDATAAGFDGHVAKPCDPAEIERLLA